ncbi:transposase [Nostoc sp. NIES-4103]|nr:transposase [Nostoc sp. NIES-4103]
MLCTCNLRIQYLSYLVQDVRYPRFKKNCRSVEYKTSGWSLSPTRKQITFTDNKGIGKLKLKGTWDLNYYQLDQIKRVRLVRRADGYHIQFLVDAENKMDVELTGKAGEQGRKIWIGNLTGKRDY